MLKVLIAIASVLLLITGAYYYLETQDLQHSPSSKITHPVSNTLRQLSLTQQNGSFTLNDVEQHVVVVSIGFTHCPDICPMGLAKLGSALKTMTEEKRTMVLPMFISVDPNRDTPENLATYTQFFHPDIIGATSTPDILNDLSKELGAFFRLVKDTTDPTKYTVEHSANTYILNLRNNSLNQLPHSSTPAEIAASIIHELPSP